MSVGTTEYDPGWALATHIAYAALTGLLFTLLSIRFLPGPLGAALGVGQGLAWCCVLLARHRDPWHANVSLFGLSAGDVELVADAWLVRSTGTLVYPAGPSLLASPAYMPAAWLGMLSAGMAIGILLRCRLSLPVASVVTSLALSVYIPVYEWFACEAEWWWYRDLPLILGAVPGYIVLGELILALPLVAATERLARVGPTAALGLGAAQGLWIFASYWLAWQLVGRG